MRQKPGAREKMADSLAVLAALQTGGIPAIQSSDLSRTHREHLQSHRFLKPVLASCGYPWTVIPVEHRAAYMPALEAAIVGRDIKPFTELLASLVEDGLRGERNPTVPGR